MKTRTQTGFWAALAALGLFAAPVPGQGVHSEYTQTPGTATRDQNETVQQINPNAEGNVPGDRTDMPSDVQGGVYQPPANRATDQDSMTYRGGDTSAGARDPDWVSDYQVQPNDLVSGTDGMNVRATQGTVTRGNGTSINRPDSDRQLSRDREQRGARSTTTRGTRGSHRKMDRDDRGGATGSATGTRSGTGTQGSAITPWVTNPGPGITPPGTVTSPGTTTPGTTTPGTTTPGGTVPGTTAPGGVTTPGTTTPGATVPPGSLAPGETAPGSTAPGWTVPGTTPPSAPGTAPGSSPGAGGSAGGIGGSGAGGGGGR